MKVAIPEMTRLVDVLVDKMAAKRNGLMQRLQGENANRAGKWLKGVLCLINMLFLFYFAPSSLGESVRSVSVGSTTIDANIAEKARNIGNALYPKVVDLVNSNPLLSPKQFDITFKSGDLGIRALDGNSGRRGCVLGGLTKGKHIILSADLISKTPALLDFILIHEMAHVAQNYGRQVPNYWVEGIANFAAFKLGYTNGLLCPECSFESPYYTAEFRCAGAFLLFLEGKFGTGLIRSLNSRIRSGDYTDEFFDNATGSALTNLWEEFKMTEAYTPMAKSVVAVTKELGISSGRRPKDLEVRIKRYWDEQGETNASLFAVLAVDKMSLDEIVTALAIRRFRASPQGQIVDGSSRFLADILKLGVLPGFTKDETRHLVIQYPEGGFTGSYPVTNTYFFYKANDASLYRYKLSKSDNDTPWKLIRAWKEAPSGELLEEYSVCIGKVSPDP